MAFWEFVKDFATGSPAPPSPPGTEEVNSQGDNPK